MGTITRNAANNFTTGGVILPAAINDTSVASLTELENVATGGPMTLIKEITASSSATLSFVHGTDGVVLDSTYPIYRFEFINCHPQTNNVGFTFNMSTDSGSNYNVTKTSTAFRAIHNETGADASLAYRTNDDLAQSTAFQPISPEMGNDADECTSGSMTLYNPSSTTFVKHFIATTNLSYHDNYSFNYYVAGYGNTVSAVNAIRFQMSSGNIDDGKIKLYGIKDS